MTFLSHYEVLADASLAMLEAARVGDWLKVADIEGLCVQLVVQLKASKAHRRLSRAERQRKRELIRRILAQDAEIRDLLEPRFTHIGRLINLPGMNRSQRL